MGALAQTYAPIFLALQAIAALYLLATGITLLRSTTKPKTTAPSPAPPHTKPASPFLAGLLLTLGDLKAILFYAALFPTFFDLTTIRPHQLALILLLTLIAVGGIKLLYALAAAKAATKWLPNRSSPHLTRLAALLMLTAATLLLSKLILHL